MLGNLAAFLTEPLSLWGFEIRVLDILLKIALPIVVAIFLYKLILFLIRKLVLNRIRVKEELNKKIYRYTRLSLRILFLLGLILLILVLVGPNIAQFFLGFWRVLANPFFSAGNSQISIVTVLLIIPIFYLGSWISRITKRFVETTLLTRFSLAEETKFTISILMRNGVMILTILVGLSMLGIDLSALTILFGVLGIGLGFGLQGLVANFFAGVVLIFERPIKEGDRIKVGDLEGYVVQIRFRATVINTITNETIIVPNRRLVEDNIHNYSYIDNRIIVVNRVTVSYETDLDRAREVLLGVNEFSPYAVSAPAPEVRVIAFQDSGILMELRTWIKLASAKLRAEAWINYEIWKRFKDADIRIPFPQRDLHIKEIPKNILSEPLP
jgi:small-conductance mechanosensitive channel